MSQKKGKIFSVVCMDFPCSQAGVSTFYLPIQPTQFCAPLYLVKNLVQWFQEMSYFPFWHVFQSARDAATAH